MNRCCAGELVFNDAAARRKLNQATHLPVALEILRQLIWGWLIGRTVVIVDMPLLFETKTNRSAGDQPPFKTATQAAFGFSLRCKSSSIAWRPLRV
jgi:hypothetical protein